MNDQVEAIAKAMEQVATVQTNCGHCRYFFSERGNQGACRRFPPQVGLIMAIPADQILKKRPEPMPMPVTNFPQMMATGWCGEWALKTN